MIVTRLDVMRKALHLLTKDMSVCTCGGFARNQLDKNLMIGLTLSDFVDEKGNDFLKVVASEDEFPSLVNDVKDILVNRLEMEVGKSIEMKPDDYIVDKLIETKESRYIE